MMNDAEYVEYEGLKCPVCKSMDIGPVSNLEVVSDSPVVIQEIVCNSCNSYWTDEYCLVGYSNLMGEDND